MTYNTIILMANDGDLIQRFTACAAQEGVPGPDGWAYSNRWALAGYDQAAIDAYASAEAGDTDEIGGYGKRQDVITDGVILAIVQALWLEQNPPLPAPDVLGGALAPPQPPTPMPQAPVVG